MKRILPLIIVVAVMAAGPVVAQTIVCDGLACGGSGTVSCGGTRSYVYRIAHPNPESPDSVYIGTHDPNPANYTGICMPSGWNFSIISVPQIDYNSLTLHGVVSPGPTGACPYAIFFENVSGTKLSAVPLDFGFDHDNYPHDVNWHIAGFPAGNADWNAAVGGGLGPVHGLQDCDTICEFPAERITYVCLAGNKDNFSQADGAEPAFPSPALLAVLNSCPNGPLNACNPAWDSEFDCPGNSRCFGHTFADCWDTTHCVIRAQLCFKLRGRGGNPGADGFYLMEDGVTVWSIPINDLQMLANGDPTWDQNDVLEYCLDLKFLPLTWSGITNVMAILTDQDLDVYIQDDTEVDYLELTVETCCFDCWVTGDIDGDGIPFAMADLQVLIEFVYSLGPPPLPFCWGDLNDDGFIDHGDIETFLCYLQSGPVCLPSVPPIAVDCNPDTVRGCCCNALQCVVRSSANCQAAGGGTYLGDGTTCPGSPFPLIVSTTPAQNALHVPVSTNISVTFDSDMDAATINSSSFVVNAALSGLHQGTFTYDGPTKTVTFDPHIDFAPGEVVTTGLTTGIESSGGTALGGSYSWSFTIAAAAAPATFSPGPIYPVHGLPQSIMAADFNGDGNCDLATLASVGDLDSINVYLNDGFGNMTLTGVYPVEFQGGATGKPSGIAADYDRDGFIDIAAVKSFADADSICMMKNDGSGVLYSTGIYPVEFQGGATGKPASCAADFDGDTDIDLAVLSSFGDEDSVCIMANDGSGALYSTGVFPVTLKGSSTGKGSIIAADLDGDGDSDLGVVKPFVSGDSLCIMKNDGGGVMYATGVYPVEFQGGASGKPASYAANFDGDTDIDIAVVNSFVDMDSVCIMKNNGSGVMYATGVYPVEFQGGASGKPASCAADFDGDGDIDIAAMNSFESLPPGTYTDSICILKNDGGGVIYATGVYPVEFQGGASGKPASCAADFDGDGDIDLAYIRTDVDSMVILFNKPSCDCGVWGDLNDDGGVNPVDVVYIVNYVYKNLDDRIQPPDCPYEAGDVNCDNSVNPIDVVRYVNYVYKNITPFPCEGCE